MLFVGRFFTFSNTEEKQTAIAGVDQRVNALEIIAELPVIAAAVNLVAAIARLATMAA